MVSMTFFFTIFRNWAVKKQTKKDFVIRCQSPHLNSKPSFQLILVKQIIYITKSGEKSGVVPATANKEQEEAEIRVAGGCVIYRDPAN